MLTKSQIEYMSANPTLPMDAEIFAECIRQWHEFGEPTKKNEPERLEAERRYQLKREKHLQYERELYRRNRINK